MSAASAHRPSSYAAGRPSCPLVGGIGRNILTRSVWHDGVQQGFTSDLWILPGRRFALAILTNLEGGRILGLEGLGNQIADIVLE